MKKLKCKRAWQNPWGRYVEWILFPALGHAPNFQEYNREAKNLSDSELKAKFKGVEKAWATAYKTQEEKLNLATQTYEMVS